jgi:hypothetical protein
MKVKNGEKDQLCVKSLQITNIKIIKKFQNGADK